MKKTKRTKKPFVKRDTIWNAVGGGFSNPNESKICKVGRHKVLLTRAGMLNKYGNPIHTATLIKPDETLGKSYRSSGSATFIVSEALKRNGISTKY